MDDVDIMEKNTILKHSEIRYFVFNAIFIALKTKISDKCELKGTALTNH